VSAWTSGETSRSAIEVLLIRLRAAIAARRPHSMPVRNRRRFQNRIRGPGVVAAAATTGVVARTDVREAEEPTAIQDGILCGVLPPVSAPLRLLCVCNHLANTGSAWDAIEGLAAARTGA
jgi:hypothetical protein